MLIKWKFVQVISAFIFCKKVFCEAERKDTRYLGKKLWWNRFFDPKVTMLTSLCCLKKQLLYPSHWNAWNSCALHLQSLWYCLLSKWEATTVLTKECLLCKGHQIQQHQPVYCHPCHVKHNSHVIFNNKHQTTGVGSVQFHKVAALLIWTTKIKQSANFFGVHKAITLFGITYHWALSTISTLNDWVISSKESMSFRNAVMWIWRGLPASVGGTSYLL